MDRPHSMDAAMDRLIDAALPHVAFDGWSEATLRAAALDSRTAPGLARALLPRGPVDLALAWHRRGDQALRDTLGNTDLSALRFRDRIAHAVKLRLSGADRETLRRSAALFALPQHSLDGTAAIWGTADAIWAGLGDRSRDLNWYTKRATLSVVYSATLLYWLGDASQDCAATWDFLDRRIDNVMAFEAAKARFRENPVGKALLAGPLKILERIHAPERPSNLPGSAR